MAVGPKYVFRELFVYPPHSYLDKYTLDTKQGPIESSYYMVDFKSMYRVDSDLINRGSPPLQMKLLELSIPTRQSLREKTSLFFGEPPDEDLIAG